MREVKIRIQSSYNTAYVYAKYVQVYLRNTGEDNYNARNTLSIKFRDENQKMNLKNILQTVLHYSFILNNNQENIKHGICISK